MKTFRLNKKFDSQYTLFVVNGDTVTVRRFEYYTGPQIGKDQSLSSCAARKLYLKMTREGWYSV